MAGQRIRVPPVFLDVLPVVALRTSQPEHPLLQDRIGPVPQRQPQAQVMVNIGQPRHAVLVPPERTGPGMIMRKILPRVATVAVVLPNRAPGPFRQVRPPLVPRIRLEQVVFRRTRGLGQPGMLSGDTPRFRGRRRRVVGHGVLPRKRCRPNLSRHARMAAHYLVHRPSTTSCAAPGVPSGMTIAGGAQPWLPRSNNSPVVHVKSGPTGRGSTAAVRRPAGARGGSPKDPAKDQLPRSSTLGRASSSLRGSSSTLTSLNVMTRTLLTNRAER